MPFGGASEKVPLLVNEVTVDLYYNWPTDSEKLVLLSQKIVGFWVGLPVFGYPTKYTAPALAMMRWSRLQATDRFWYPSPRNCPREEERRLYPQLNQTFSSCSNGWWLQIRRRGNDSTHTYIHQPTKTIKVTGIEEAISYHEPRV